LNTAVQSISQQTWTDWELIVVGQGPDPMLKAVGYAATEADPRVRYVHSDQLGLSRARNIGTDIATGSIVAFIDDDCEARADWLQAVAYSFAEHPEVGLVGGAVAAPKVRPSGFASCPAFTPEHTIYDPVASGRRAPVGWDWIGANFAVRRTIMERVGPFDLYLGAGTVVPAGEDNDYKLRLEALGVKMLATPSSVVYHTYGYRYGLKAVLRQQQNYAAGNGALAAKLTLLGDPRGIQWLRNAQWRYMVDSLRAFRFHRLVVDLRRAFYFTRAYYRCLHEYRANATTKLLIPAAGDSGASAVDRTALTPNAASQPGRSSE
jgi:glycosyltransferase involved in cell wall biosynthesis